MKGSTIAKMIIIAVSSVFYICFLPQSPIFALGIILNVFVAMKETRRNVRRRPRG